MVPKTNALSIRPQGLAIASAACQHDSTCNLPCKTKPSKKGDPGRIRTCNRCFVSPVKAQEPMPYPFGHRVKRMHVAMKSDPGRIRTCIYWFNRRAITQRAWRNERLPEWQENPMPYPFGRRVKCQFHKGKKKRSRQDSNLQILSNPTIPGRDMPMPYPFGHRVKYREIKRDAHNDWQRNPTRCGK